MAHYGRDYTSGRYIRRNLGDTGSAYDSDYGNWYGDTWLGSRGRWNQFDRNWSGRGRSAGMSSFDDPWRAPGYGYGWGQQTPQDWVTNRWQPGWGTGGMGRGRMGNYGGLGRSFYDQDMYAGRHSHDYDEDLGDRFRRGWNRFREGARGWFGRGYGGNW
jgi:hypothetical protein